MFGFPDIVGFYDMLYGTAGVDLQGLTVSWFGGATGLVFSWNPPYTVTDFLGMYPKFFGPATNYTTGVTVTLGSAVVVLADTTDVSVGDLVVNPSFPKDTLVKSIDSGTQITLTNVATVSGTTLTVYQDPPVPLIVILTYVNLAMVSVMCQRYNGTWPVMMGWFVAHYLTMYLRSEAVPEDADISQIASSGLSKGILVQRAAGDVSATSKLLAELSAGYGDFGAWNETIYGEQFMTIARATNCGPIYVL